MALGFLGKEYESVVLSYDDEETPVKLCEKKMLPIVSFDDDYSSNESLDIIARADEEDRLKTKKLLASQDDLDKINELLGEIGSPVHNLAMPYWIWTPEFDENSRRYFVDKKSQKRGPFHLLAQKKQKFLDELPPVLTKVQGLLTGPYYHGETLSIEDIMIASHLWGLYVIPEFQFSNDLHRYLQSIANLCKFNYHEDFWKKEI
jgi:glutaredoxin 2